MYSYNPYSRSYLAHYGVKGMKWGVRRYQNEDGTLTSLGKKRSAYKEASAKAKKDPHDFQAQVEANYRRREFNDQKIRDKIADQKTKSKRQKDLEEQYVKQGFTKDEASIQAYKRVRTERVLAVVAGMAATGLMAYAAYKHYDNTVDRLIKSNTALGRISSNNNKSVRDAFYAFANSHDENRYTGLYGAWTIKSQGQAFKKSISVGKSGLKVASPESARKILSNLYKNDPQYRSDVRTLLLAYSRTDLTDKQKRLVKNALSDLADANVTRNVYDAVNTTLVFHGVPAADRASSKFYSALKGAGYSAIRDMNDFKYSGYNARNPLIIFDNSKINVDAVSKLGEQIVQRQNNIEMSKMAASELGKGLIPSLIPGIAAYGSVFAASSVSDNRFVRNYRKEHPNSKLSRNEILRLKDSK